MFLQQVLLPEHLVARLAWELFLLMALLVPLVIPALEHPLGADRARLVLVVVHLDAVLLEPMPHQHHLGVVTLSAQVTTEHVAVDVAVIGQRGLRQEHLVALFTREGPKLRVRVRFLEVRDHVRRVRKYHIAQVAGDYTGLAVPSRQVVSFGIVTVEFQVARKVSVGGEGFVADFAPGNGFALVFEL